MRCADSLYPYIVQHIIACAYFTNYILNRFKKGSLVPSVQYVHFLAMPTSTATQSPAMEGIFEGHNLQELDPQYRIEVSMPLGAVVDLRDAACAVGDCREALLTAVNSLFDAFSNDSCSSFGGADEHLPKVIIYYIVYFTILMLSFVCRC